MKLSVSRTTSPAKYKETLKNLIIEMESYLLHFLKKDDKCNLHYKFVPETGWCAMSSDYSLFSNSRSYVNVKLKPRRNVKDEKSQRKLCKLKELSGKSYSLGVLFGY